MIKRTSKRAPVVTDREISQLAGVRRNIQQQIDENLSSSTAWVSITGKPSTFAPSDHASDHVTGGGDAIQLASASQDGLLSHDDWQTFNAGTSNYRAGKENLSAGNPDVTFSSAFGDTDYYLSLTVYDASGIVGYDGIVKAVGKFTILGLSVNATVEYYAVEYK